MYQKELADSLRKLAADLSGIADALDTPAAEAPPEPKVAQPEAAEDATTEQEPEKTYSYEEARGILARVSHAGHHDEVKALVMSHGGTSISSYKDQPDVLAQLVKEAEGLIDGK